MIFDYAFIDFDNTIYESHLLVDHIKQVFLRHGVTEEDFRTTLERGVHGENGQYYDYSFELHIALLTKKRYSLDQKILLTELNTAFDASLQAFDAEDFLRFMREKTKKLILLTAGNNTFQSKKMSSTNLTDFFDEIHILHEDKQAYVRELNRDGQKNIFINDNLKQNCAIRDLFPNITVITRRHPRKYTDEDMKKTQIPYFTTLTEIKEYIKNM